jgi:CHAT domain-containing protein
MSRQQISLGQTESLKQRAHFYALAIVFLVATMAPGSSKPLRYRGGSLLPASSRQQTGAIANNQESPRLSLDQPVEKEIADGEVHDYAISLSAGQFACLTVQQKGVDVSERLFSPDGRLIIEFDDDLRPESEDRVAFLAETSGVYRLQVKAKARAAPGRYEIKLTAIRSATQQDRLLFESRGLDHQAGDLAGAAKYDEALPLAARALEIAESQLGSADPYVAYLLDKLAQLHYLKGDYAKAAELSQRSLAIDEKALGREHPESVLASERLGVIHSDLNEYDQAEELLQQALQLTEKTLGPEHPRLVLFLIDISNLHQHRGDLRRAEQELERAISIADKSLPVDSSPLLRVLNNLGVLYNSEKDYARAEPLLLRSLQIGEKKYGRDSYQVSMQLQNLGLIAQEKSKDYPRALELYWRAERNLEHSVGAENPRVAGILNNIANVYKSQGEYAKALELHQRVFSILQAALGPYHGLTLISIGNIAKTYAGLGDIANAVKFQILADEAIEKNLGLNLAIGSERQKLAYFDSLTERTDRTISLHADLAPNDPAARDLAALAILQRKGRVLDAMSGSLDALRQRMNADDQKVLDELNATTAQLARLSLNGPGKMPPSDYRKQISALEERKENLEAEASRRSAEFRSQSQPVTLAAVQGAIPSDAALIEFAIYRPFDPKKDGDQAYGEPRYAAYILPAQGEVRWTELGPAKEIDARVDAFRQSLRDPQRNDIRQRARAVDEKTMQPVRSLLGSANHLLISADGALNLIPFAALVDEHGKYLVETNTISYLTSGRDLLRFQVKRESKSPPVVVADPNFGEPALRAASGRSSSNGVADKAGARIDYSQMFFGPLPGVADEVRALRELLPQATFLTKEQVTKAALMRVNGPSILHIATHGFFLPDAHQPGNGPQIKDQTRAASSMMTVDNPLLRSGLALAGANRGLGGDDAGLLTAFEAADLDLWGTKLVVLSACDTGLGEVKNGDGVYGLRRALVLAGAESQMMSLWPVSDRSTRDLMVGYYKGLLSGACRSEALRHVQLQMLHSKTHEHPFYWAVFIQTGAWTSLEGKR